MLGINKGPDFYYILRMLNMLMTLFDVAAPNKSYPQP